MILDTEEDRLIAFEQEDIDVSRADFSIFKAKKRLTDRLEYLLKKRREKNFSEKARSYCIQDIFACHVALNNLK